MNLFLKFFEIFKNAVVKDFYGNLLLVGVVYGLENASHFSLVNKSGDVITFDFASNQISQHFF